MLEGCRGRWRVAARERVWKFFRKQGLAEEFRVQLSQLEDSLNSDPAMTYRLLRERKIAAAAAGGSGEEVPASALAGCGGG